MFGIIADLISSVLTILFPIFASYKALRTSRVADVAPWLMYWVVFSIAMLIESWTVFIIGWIPFYSWFRLFALCYLVLPQTQGAARIYLEHVEPFLVHHEREIEHFITRSHERARDAGLEQLYRLVDLVRARVLGLPPAWSGDAAGAGAAAGGPAQTILSRFNVPSTAATDIAGAVGDLSSMLTSALGSAASSSKPRPESTAVPPDDILPREFATASRNEQAQYITSLRDRLGYFMNILDRQGDELELDRAATADAISEDLAYGTSYDYGPKTSLRKNQSENSFENIDHEDLGASTAYDRDDIDYYERRRRRH